MLAAAVTTSVAACGGDDSSDVPEVPTVASTPAQGSGSAGAGTDVTNPSVRPSVATLNEMLNKALDPNVPNSEKTQLVQGSEKDPNIFDKLVKAKADNPDATYKLSPPVLAAGPNRGSVKVTVQLPGNPPQKLDAQIVYDKGRWKLASDSVCPVLQFQNIRSAMCPAPAGGASQSAPN
ncbi:hypothetical protein GCM10009624_33590 [Gordonia sinesedis]